MGLNFNSIKYNLQKLLETDFFLIFSHSTTSGSQAPHLPGGSLLLSKPAKCAADVITTRGRTSTEKHDIHRAH